MWTDGKQLMLVKSTFSLGMNTELVELQSKKLRSVQECIQDEFDTFLSPDDFRSALEARGPDAKGHVQVKRWMHPPFIALDMRIKWHTYCRCDNSS